MRRATGPIGFLFVLLVGGGSAQADGVPADRPSFSASTSTVPARRFVLETGYQWSSGDDPDRATQSLPVLAIRVGLSARSEVGILWGGWNIDDYEVEGSETSVSDFALAGKFALHAGERAALTAYGLVSFPVGTEPSTADSVNPLVGLLWGLSATGRMAFFGTAQTQSFEFEGDRTADLELAAGASFALSGRLGSFVEMYTIVPFESGLDESVVVDAALTWQWRPTVQFDLNGSVGLDADTGESVGAGVAMLF